MRPFRCMWWCRDINLEHDSGAVEIKEVDLQDPQGWDNVKLRFSFAPSKVSSLRQLSSQKEATLPVSRTCQWAVDNKGV